MNNFRQMLLRENKSMLHVIWESRIYNEDTILMWFSKSRESLDIIAVTRQSFSFYHLKWVKNKDFRRYRFRIRKSYQLDFG